MITKHFSEISEKQVDEMADQCIDSAIRYSNNINMGGLSHNGVHNLYDAIRNAIEKEWKKSRRIMKVK